MGTLARIVKTPIVGLYRVFDSAIGAFVQARPIHSACQRVSKFGILHSTSNLIVIVLTVSLLARMAMFFAFPSFYPREVAGLEADSYFYDQSAMNGLHEGNFSTYWSPGFSMFLGSMYFVAGHNVVVPAAILIFIGSMISVVVFLTTLKLFKSQKGALLAGLIVGLEPTLIRESPMVLSDTLSLFLFTLVIYFIVSDSLSRRLWYSAALGGLVGFLAMTRAQYEFLIPLYVLIVAIAAVKLRKIRMKDAVIKLAVFLLVLGLVLGPWIAYTNEKLGRPVIVTNGGVNFYKGNNENATGRAMYAPLNYSDELTVNSEGYRQGIDFIVHNPEKAITLYLKKAGLIFFVPQRMPGEWPDNPPPFWTSLAYGLVANLSFILVEVLGFLGIVSAYMRKSPTVITFAIIGLVSYAIPIAYVVEDRYLMPLVPVLAIFGSEYLRRKLDAPRPSVS